MTTHLLSTDHRLSGFDIVARLGTVAPGLGPDFLETVPALRGVLMLSTCSRLTLLIDADSWADTDCPAALHPDLRPVDASQSVTAPDLGETITAFLAERAGLPMSDLLLTYLVGATARQKMLAITMGLSSVVVGEAQIVGQVRRVAETAAAEGTLSPELVWVAGRASAIVRRMAHETELSGQGRSIVVVGVSRTANRLPPLEDCHALIVGTGPCAGATIADLHARGLTDIAVYSASNRTEAFAAGHGLRAIPTGALSETMSRADLVVICHGTDEPILAVDVTAPVTVECAGSAGGAGHPLVILDLALTRGVDEAVGALPGVIHLGLTRMRNAAPDTEARQVTTARVIVEVETVDFECILAERATDPLITALRAQVGRAATEEAAHLHPQPARRLALTVPVIDGRARTSVSGVNSANAAAGACPHRHLTADPGFEAASEVDGESMVPLTQTERVLHHLAARLLHQPIIMARRAGQGGCEEVYRQALELVWGLESTGGNHD